MLAVPEASAYPPAHDLSLYIEPRRRNKGTCTAVTCRTCGSPSANQKRPSLSLMAAGIACHLGHVSSTTMQVSNFIGNPWVGNMAKVQIAVWLGILRV